MSSGRERPAGVMIILLALGCGLLPTAVPPGQTAVQRATPAAARDNGPGAVPESPDESPPDHPLPATELPAQVPPLCFFYAIHTHGTGDYLPYTDQSMSSLDAQTAANMVAAIESIAEVLDRYGVKGTWQVVYGTATGLCEYGGEAHVLRSVQDRWHEIGAHVHRVNQIDDAYYALREDCGIVPQTMSGFVVLISGAGQDEARTAMSAVLQQSADVGMTVGMENISPAGGSNPLAAACNEEIGIGNDMWPETGNLVFPWHPDYLGGDICADDPQGQTVLLDHVSITSLILSGEGGPPDVLGAQQFDQLRAQFDSALAFMEEQRPQRAAVWGFVTHITEYAIGGRAENPPHPEALAALDSFLAYVDTKRAEGRVVYATASEIAAVVLTAP